MVASIDVLRALGTRGPKSPCLGLKSRQRSVLSRNVTVT